MRLRFQGKYNIIMNSEHPALGFMARHAAFLLTRFAVKSDGLTRYRRLKCKDYTGELAEFGEAVWFKRPEPEVRQARLEERWALGLWYGKSEKSDEQMLGTPDGLTCARSVQRRIVKH